MGKNFAVLHHWSSFMISFRLTTGSISVHFMYILFRARCLFLHRFILVIWRMLTIYYHSLCFMWHFAQKKMLLVCDYLFMNYASFKPAWLLLIAKPVHNKKSGSLMVHSCVLRTGKLGNIWIRTWFSWADFVHELFMSESGDCHITK